MRYDAQRVVKNPSIHYTTPHGGYLFRHNGTYLCVIDFSRAILSPDHEALAVEGGDAQADAIAANYLRYFPEFAKLHAKDIKIATFQHMRSVFKVYSAIDMYAWASKMLMMVDTQKIDIAPENRRLLKDIVGICTTWLVDKMINLFRDRSAPESIDRASWCNEEIMVRLFASYRDTGRLTPETEIIDWYVYASPQYSLMSYDKFPPYLQEAKETDPKTGKTQVLTPKATIKKRVVEQGAECQKYEQDVDKLDKDETI